MCTYCKTLSSISVEEEGLAWLGKVSLCTLATGKNLGFREIWAGECNTMSVYEFDDDILHSNWNRTSHVDRNSILVKMVIITNPRTLDLRTFVPYKVSKMQVSIEGCTGR